MTGQPKSTALKKQQNTLRYAKSTLQIAIWLIFGVIGFSVAWDDLLLLAIFMLGAAASYAAVIYHFETQEASVRNELAQASLQ